MAVIKITLFLVFVVFMYNIGIPLIYIESQKSKPKSDDGLDYPHYINNTPPMIARDLSVVKTISAKDLLHDYDGTEEAENDYTDQLVRISGTVLSNSTDIYGGGKILLDAGNSFWPVIVWWNDEYEGWAAFVKKDATVDWVCFVTGRDKASPILRRCAPV